MTVWYYFTKEEARIIVEDEGEGFQAIKDWNEFNNQRQKCLQAFNDLTGVPGTYQLVMYIPKTNYATAPHYRFFSG